MKLVQAYLSVRKDVESGFHHSGCPVKLVQDYLSTRKELESSFHYCESSCNARASLFICVKGLTNRF